MASKANARQKEGIEDGLKIKNIGDAKHTGKLFVQRFLSDT